MGFFAEPEPTGGAWSVTEVTNYIRELFEIDFRLQDLQVTGEISNFTRARSGHLYFTLKDEQAQLKCVMWRSSAERLRYRPEDGDAVSVHGRISVYEAGGVYQLYATRMEPLGRGDLVLAFERLKEQLLQEGLFDETHKQPLPVFPLKLGIVTSADAAALRDILNVLARRYPAVRVLIAPTLVQGEQAPAQIVRALQWLDGRNDIDTIILARGGGAIEDLWAFNDERVARAVFAARHPIISGVGHETDFTIVDFVADVRAPTPSAAAELAVPDAAAVRQLLEERRQQLVAHVRAGLQAQSWQLQSLRQRLNLLSPRSQLDSNRQLIDALQNRLEQLARRHLAQVETRLAVAQAGLTAVSPLATLARGYAIVRLEDGRIVRRVADAAPGKGLDVQVSDGRFGATVDE